MKSTLSKSQAQEKIKSFFSQKTFSAEQVKKIKRLAMKYKIRLGPLRRKFCKSCLSQLNGAVNISRTHKTIICQNCSHKNTFKLT
jgi:RNase P subunit RPR2